MENAQLIALSRQATLRTQLDVVANNLANINTTGYKSQKLQFVEYIMPVADATAFQPADAQLSYVDMFKTHTDFDYGALKVTGNDYDMALSGEGFFVVQQADGTEAFTRNGAFYLDNNGQLVSSEGLPVLTDGGPVFFAPEDGAVQIAPDGTISTEQGNRGKIRVAEFEDVRTLEKIGTTMFAGNNPQPAVDFRVVQGALEQSNVYGITEVTQLIEVTRAYDSVSKLVKDLDELRKQAIQTLGTTKA